MKTAHARELVTQGSIFINTLHAYNDVVRLGSDIGDEHEGVAFLESNNDFSTDRPWTIPPHIRHEPTMQWDKTKAPIDFIGLNMRAPALIENQYVLCFCGILDPAIMRRLGYTAIVEIADVDLFVKLIGNNLHRKGLASGRALLGPCLYGSKSVDAWNPVASPVWFLKPKVYEWQREVRAIWEPIKYGVLLSSRKISVGALKKIVKIVHMEPSIALTVPPG